ncbi:MAG: SDR family oxidoreductase [Deltaproteobacteria bacterium]|nr:MAG: SDR family oxidoreductase [Deltaproteobacteria bacterium]
MAGLERKVVMITGGSGGLGAELARAFAAQGCRVAITARNQAKLNAIAEKIALNGGQALALPCDVTQRANVKSLDAEIRSAWGEVQILVNNAGIARAVNFSDMPDDLWDKTLETNLTGAYNCCKVFLPAMIKTWITRAHALPGVGNGAAGRYGERDLSRLRRRRANP